MFFDASFIFRAVGANRHWRFSMTLASLGFCLVGTMTFAAEAGYGRIVFSSNRDGNYELYTMKNDGTDVKRLTDTPYHEREPEWSPDGKKIVYKADRNNNSQIFLNQSNGNRIPMYEIWVMDADGSNQKQLTDHGKNAGGPSWSHDGKMIAYHEMSSTITGAAVSLAPMDIWVMNADGSERTQMTQTDETEGYPTFSPNDKKLIFHRYINRSWNLWRIDMDGENFKPMTERRSVDWMPVCRPGSKDISFFSGRTGDFEVHTMSYDGKNKQTLTQEMGRIQKEVCRPSWSPDGRYVVFVTLDSRNDLEIVRFDTEKRERLELTKHTAVDTEPHWCQAKR